jgi:hypothetical protein
MKSERPRVGPIPHIMQTEAIAIKRLTTQELDAAGIAPEVLFT